MPWAVPATRTPHHGTFVEVYGAKDFARKHGDVERRLAEAMDDAARGIVLDAGTLTFGQWLDSWLSDGLKPLVDAGKMTYSTHKRYTGIVGKHPKPALGHRKLKDVTRVEVRKLYAAKGETLSPRSVDYSHITLQKALSQAVRDDLVPRNVAAGERPHSRHAKVWPAIEPLFFESIFRVATLTTKDPATPKGHTPEILQYLRGDLRRPIPDPLY